MRLIDLLIPKEKIVGMEINSQKIRMLYLELNSDGIPEVRGKSEVDLESGVIVSNSIKNKKKLNEAIFKLKKGFKPQKALSFFAVISIAQNGVYSEVIEFPKTLDNDQLFEAISLNTAQNLPLPLSECYMDWQVIESNETKNKILISQISKKIANEYIDILKENGFNLIALEAPFLSMERAVSIPDSPVIFLYFTDDGVTSIIYSKKLPYFSQFESWKEASLENEVKDIKGLNMLIKNKIKKLTAYFESKYEQKIEKTLLMSNGFDANVIVEKLGPTSMPMEKAQPKINSLENSDWVPAAGAAARAFIPRSDDTIISLLPVGTENLYETQKSISFANSILLLVSSVTIFYIAAFASFFFLIASLENDINKQSDLINSSSISQEDIKIETETKEFNDYVKDMNLMYAQTGKNNASILNNISKINAPGVIITNIAFTDPAKPILISGIASSRNNLNAFRSKLENSTAFKNIKFSLGDIAQKDNVAFNISLYSK